jgi:DNA polymerase
MSSRRHLLLEEMGLTPVWRLRAEKPRARPTVLDPAPSAPAAAVSLASDAPSQAPQQGADRRGRILTMEWPQVKAEVAGCTACALHAKRTQTVFGVGDEQADWLFVGEGPGAEEDARGEPFVGQAGKLLDNMLASIGLRRGENVYIANVVKCRPPGNRNPDPQEAAACEPFLARQIALIQPRLLIALGRVAAVNLLARDATIASLRGRVHDWRGTPLLVTYHPAYLLRNLPDKAKAWDDLCLARETMTRIASGPSGAR